MKSFLTSLMHLVAECNSRINTRAVGSTAIMVAKINKINSPRVIIKISKILTNQIKSLVQL